MSRDSYRLRVIRHQIRAPVLVAVGVVSGFVCEVAVHAGERNAAGCAFRAVGAGVAVAAEPAEERAEGDEGAGCDA